MSGRGRHAAHATATGRPVSGVVVQLALLSLSFVLISALVVTASRAAFVAQTDSVGNRVTSATIALTDNDAGSSMFTNVTGLAPGTTVDRCITVSYSGTVTPTAVEVYAGGAPTGGLAPYLNLAVEIGAATADAFGGCTSFTPTTALYTGTLADFATTHAGYASGVPTWTPAGSNDSRTFRFRISVQDTLAAQGLTSDFGFSWETRTS